MPVTGNLKYRRDFRKLTSLCKVKHMNDEKLPSKLLSNESDKVKSKGHLQFFGERMKSPQQILGDQIKEALGKRECEEFEIALQHKSKLRVYKELKRGVGIEEYLEYMKGPPSRLLFKFRSVTHGLFEELGRHANRGGSQEFPNCGACKESVEHVLFECASYDS